MEINLKFHKFLQPRWKFRQIKWREMPRNKARRQYIRNFKKLDIHMVVELQNGTQLWANLIPKYEIAMELDWTRSVPFGYLKFEI